MARIKRVIRRVKRNQAPSKVKKRCRKSRRAGLIDWGSEKIQRGADARSGVSKQEQNRT